MAIILVKTPSFCVSYLFLYRSTALLSRSSAHPSIPKLKAFPTKNLWPGFWAVALNHKISISASYWTYCYFLSSKVQPLEVNLCCWERLDRGKACHAHVKLRRFRQFKQFSYLLQFVQLCIWRGLYISKLFPSFAIAIQRKMAILARRFVGGLKVAKNHFYISLKIIKKTISLLHSSPSFLFCDLLFIEACLLWIQILVRLFPVFSVFSHFDLPFLTWKLLATEDFVIENQRFRLWNVSTSCVTFLIIDWYIRYLHLAFQVA